MTEINQQGARKSASGLGDPNGVLPFPHVTGYWVNRLGAAFRTVVDREVKDFDLTRRQVAMMIHVERAESQRGDSPTASHLTRSLGVDSTAVTRMLDRLEEKGLLARSPDPSDGRRHLIGLTSEARTLLPKLKKTARKVEACFEAGIPVEDLRTFQRVMMQMLENAGESLDATIPHHD
ncbi:Transcriptional regulator SlyA [Planctomycetes bacterium Poly30]|uniref:Transcriptional regulator SlyA n=1 Tax=Saltatorellus ferox TaxID=2528018 RepID=A0A518ENZ0_9BACT|nr:Transcriptional regulator SlyA [Planctomycetes bacterium Poly30]